MERIAGFTLIELMVTLGIAVILAVIAVPAYHNFVSGSRASAAINALASTVALARSEAITRGEQVSACPSSNALAMAMPPACSNVSWAKGWIVFADNDGDGSYDPGSDDLIRVHRGLSRDVTVTSSGLNDFIAFNRMGFAQPTFQDAGNAPLTIVACPADKKGVNARALVLALSGDVKTAARQSDGSAFSC